MNHDGARQERIEDLRLRRFVDKRRLFDRLLLLGAEAGIAIGVDVRQNRLHRQNGIEHDALLDRAFKHRIQDKHFVDLALLERFAQRFRELESDLRNGAFPAIGDERAIDPFDMARRFVCLATDEIELDRFEFASAFLDEFASTLDDVVIISTAKTLIARDDDERHFLHRFRTTQKRMLRLIRFQDDVLYRIDEGIHIRTRRHYGRLRLA